MSDQPSLFNTDENAPPVQEEEPEVLTPTSQVDNGQTRKPVEVAMFKTITAWQKYYDEMGQAREKVIERLAKQQEFQVILQPLYDEHNKLIKPDEAKTFRRRKISTKDFFETERMRGVLQNLQTKNPLEVRSAMVELYKKMAGFYLEDVETGEIITEEQFWRIHWPVNKAILDACNLSSVLGQIPLDLQI